MFKSVRRGIARESLGSRKGSSSSPSEYSHLPQAPQTAPPSHVRRSIDTRGNSAYLEHARVEAELLNSGRTFAGDVNDLVIGLSGDVLRAEVKGSIDVDCFQPACLS